MFQIVLFNKKIHKKYSLTEGISEKVYNKIINQIINNLPDLDEWHNPEILKNFNNVSWKEAVKTSQTKKYW